MADSAESPPCSSEHHCKPKTLLGRYELGRLLGRGSTAKVRHARHLPTGRRVAIKTIPRHALLQPNRATQLIREVAALRRLRQHPHVVRLHEVLATRTHVHFVMDHAGGGDLFSLLSARGRLPENLACSYLVQLASALAYCHAAGVFHRDLKPENLLLDENNNLLVSDFGLSAVSESALRPNELLLHALCGTPAYVAPEVLAKKGYDGAKVDVWSCGVILFVLNAGYLPFNDANLMVMYRKIYKGKFRCPSWTSPDMQRMITRMLDTNPGTRITVDEILNDPWLQKVELNRQLVVVLEEEEEEEGRDLNAFDILSFSSGLDLSVLFGAEVERERFVLEEAAERVVGAVEEAGRKERLGVRRGKKGWLVEVEGLNGEFKVSVQVRGLAEGIVVVELTRWGGAAEGLWREKLWPALDGVVHRRPE